MGHTLLVYSLMKCWIANAVFPSLQDPAYKYRNILFTFKNANISVINSLQFVSPQFHFNGALKKNKGDF